jgi:hypothetical protein
MPETSTTTDDDGTVTFTADISGLTTEQIRPMFNMAFMSMVGLVNAIIDNDEDGIERGFKLCVAARDQIVRQLHEASS